VTEHWSTRTGRWRQALRKQSALPLEERLYAVIRSDIESGALPGGALLPTTERVAAEMAFEESLLKAIREAHARGLSSTEATGMFKAALERLGEIERKKEEDKDR
jgi:DNA-binding transcriptional regulator YhcF (GntR family)